MKRIAEPAELMDQWAQAKAYAEADFSESNTLFLERFSTLHPDEFSGLALDLGCGPGDIALRFARRYPLAKVYAVDGSTSMLTLAREAAQQQGLPQQVSFSCQYLPSEQLPDKGFDAVLSNSLLHHMRDPADLWRTVMRSARPGSPLLVMDLLRPEQPSGVDALVEQYASDAPEVLRADFRHSLFAAYTLDEVRQQLEQAGLQQLQAEQISDRHLAVSGYLR